MKTVVLVEDNADNTLLIEDVFAFEGVAARLVCFTTAEEALEFAMASPPDLILLDLGLPGMSGLEAAKLLRANPGTKNVPIWAVTARATKDDEELALAAGCNLYITKPYDQEELGYMVKFVVAAHRNAETSGSDGPIDQSRQHPLSRRPRNSSDDVSPSDDHDSDEGEDAQRRPR